MVNEVKQSICDILQEMGFVIFEDWRKDDFNLQNYIVDSIQFVDFIVRLEERFGTMLSDEFLDYGVLESMCGFGEMLEEYLNNK